MKGLTIATGRISALSDGVFAIAMTLLMLDLKLPELGSDAAPLQTVLLGQIPRFFSWLLSFAILCRLWLIQYVFLSRDESRSRLFTAWDFVFLGAVSFIPFPTSLLSEHHDKTLPVVIFSATLAVAGIALEGMRRANFSERRSSGQPVEPHGSPEHPARLLLVIAALATIMAVFNPRLGAMLWIAYPIVSAVGRRRRRPGR